MPRGQPTTAAARMAKLRAERQAEGWVEQTIALTPSNAAKAAQLMETSGLSVSALVNRLIEKAPVTP